MTHFYSSPSLTFVCIQQIRRLRCGMKHLLFICHSTVYSNLSAREY